MSQRVPRFPSVRPELSKVEGIGDVLCTYNVRSTLTKSYQFGAAKEFNEGLNMEVIDDLLVLRRRLPYLTVGPAWAVQKTTRLARLYCILLCHLLHFANDEVGRRIDSNKGRMLI